MVELATITFSLEITHESMGFGRPVLWGILPSTYGVFFGFYFIKVVENFIIILFCFFAKKTHKKQQQQQAQKETSFTPFFVLAKK